MSDISLGTLYDINKQAMKTAPALKSFEIKDKIKYIAKKGFEKKQFCYYMLLCREKYDFTLFNTAANNILIDLEKSSFVKDLYECLANRGEVLSIDETKNKDAFEIWIRDNEDICVYYFFPYDNGVIEVLGNE